MKDLILGIDLGITNSCVAYIDNDYPIVIENSEGKLLTPSIVTFKENKTKPGAYEAIVGDAAYRQMLINKDTVRSIKREMGNRNWKLEIGGKEYDPSDISALILKYIKDFSEEKLGLPVRKAIITIPAYFNELEAKATKEAAKKANLEVIKLLPEPEAIALAYGYGMNDNFKKKILTFSMKTSIMSIGILKINGKKIKELALQGDMHLGGDDWNQRIIDWIKSQLKDHYGIDNINSMTMQRIKEAAEKAKMELSSATETDISLPFIDMGKDNPPINFETHLTRLQFEEMTKDLFERTKEPIQKALQDANLTIDMIDDVLLDGESTEIPAIRLLLRDLFKKEPNSSINPCYVVAIGAAYYGNFVNNNSNNKQF